MTPARWSQIKEIFHAACDLPPHQRQAYVRQSAAGDEELRVEVESLLGAQDAGEFPEGSAAAYLPEALAGEAWDRNIGRLIGAYRIVRQIGEGGMGAVYLVEREGEFQRTAALKLLHPGMDSRAIVSRFHHERQILAALDHPNIARLLEGGTTEDGRPYFVMEYIEGEPIDRYAVRRELNVRERLDLFRQVCDAVQYAHRNLVVHRDIKPGNILVTGNGTPKLLDFGIAKLLHSDTLRQTAMTQAGLRLMTPEYASPEQIRGEPVTTATDVYSLGLVLYQLLAGTMPYHVAPGNPAALERAIGEAEPRPPSQAAGASITRQLRGDLDTIVLKALQKDPLRRYGSAEQLSADLQRHLAGEPIQARPRTLGYQAGRFVRRNRLSVAAVALVIVSLAGGLALAAWQARIARQRFNDVRQLAHAFLFDFNDAIQNLPGATPARRLIVDKGLQYLNSLSQQASGDDSLQRELAEAYLRVGDVQGGLGFSNLGDEKGALASYRKALAISENAVRRSPHDWGWQLYLARAHSRLGDRLTDPPLAVPHYRQAIRLFEIVAPHIAHDVDARFQMLNAYEALGDALGNPGLLNVGDSRGGRQAYETARSIAESIAAEHPDNVRAGRSVGAMKMKIADIELGQGDIQTALRDYRSAVTGFEQVSALDPLNPRTVLFLALAVGKVGSALEAAGQTQDALDQYQKACDIHRRLMEGDPKNVTSTNSYALSLQTRANLLRRTGDLNQAQALYQEALAIFGQLRAANPQNPSRQQRYAEMLVALGSIAAAEGKRTQAIDFYREGFAVYQALSERPAATADHLNAYAEQLLNCPLPEFANPAKAAQLKQRAAAIQAASKPG